jgi:hypothetical protein
MNYVLIPWYIDIHEHMTIIQLLNKFSDVVESRFQQRPSPESIEPFHIP